MQSIAEKIRDEIATAGAIPFARFMETALYCPNCGYYEKKKDIGRSGDFHTSVSVGPLFGALLAQKFSAWLEGIPAGRHPPVIAEAGAHDGTLAADILTSLHTHHPELFGKIEFRIIEPSPQRRAWQRKTLAAFENKVRWTEDLSGLTNHGAADGGRAFCGIIFSNELLDAFPVHRLGWDGARKLWFEWGVAVNGDRFVWTRLSAAPVLPEWVRLLPPALLDALPEGCAIEVCPAAEQWWRRAAAILHQGWLLTADYGLNEDEILSPCRPHGTLRGYFRHHLADDILERPGEQDITAHVNFTALERAGGLAGLVTEFSGSQSKFLTEIFARAFHDGRLSGWSRAQTRQFQTLIHPEHMGGAFRVLAQRRDSDKINRVET